MNKEKKKKGFLDGYKKYNPEKEGFGNPDQWQSAFRQRMGLEEAKRVLKDESPWEVLGVLQTATWQEIKSAYRKMAMKHHPDRDGDPEEFKKVQAAYELLEERYGKHAV